MSAFTRPQARAPEPDGRLADPDDLDDDENDTPNTVTVTFFTDHAATTKQERRLSLIALAELIHSTAAANKAALPWLKLARFGDRRTEKGSLRHNVNLVAITGIEADYDQKQMSLADAKDVIASAEITAIIYPSPSYTAAEPKWRVLAPFSREYPPAERDCFMARLNGLFGGIFSCESWVWSQSYYYGRVVNPDHHASLFEGTPIDLADWLDDGAIGRPNERNVGQKPTPKSKPEHITEARVRGLVNSLLDNIGSAEDGEKHHTLRDICLTLGGYLYLTDWSVEEAVEQAISALRSADDWDQARDTARWGIERGMQRPLDLEDRPNLRPGGGGRGAGGPQPDPTPDPEPEPEPDDTSIDVLTEIAMIGPDLTLKKLIDVFNRKYAVANEGGKAVVIWPVHDPILNRDHHERAGFADFSRFYQNHKFSVTVTDDNGKEQTITRSYAAWWLDHPRRRQYLGGVVFDPGGRTLSDTLNLWRGWAEAPRRGDWSLMQQHIHIIICGGRGEIYDYLIRWLAHMVQQPHLAAEVAIVLRGLKGTGKGMLGKWLLRLCGQHGLHIVNAGHLTGRFSGHLRDAVFIFADEAFFAGDRQHESVLKAIITEGTLLIEAKYRTPVMAPNMLHLLMASNATWVVPASHDERRYLMLDVAPDKKGDAVYFAALDRQMEQGGLAAMLYDLLHMDLGDFHPRHVPTTSELAEQKLHSLDSLHRWWMAILDRGFVWRSRYGHRAFLTWDEFISTELLVRSYQQWCADNRVTYPEHRVALGRFLTKFYRPQRPQGTHPIYEADSVDSHDPRPVVMQDRPHGYLVGDLDTARQEFATKLSFPDDACPWNVKETSDGN